MRLLEGEGRLDGLQANRRRAHGLPEPDAMVGRTPVYFRETFESRREPARSGRGGGVKQ